MSRSLKMAHPRRNLKLGTTLNQRNEMEQGAVFGIATSRTKERVACSLGQGGVSVIKFEEGQALISCPKYRVSKRDSMK